MQIEYYERMFEEFKMFWPFEVDNVKDYRPRGDHSIRIEMKDGRCLDYDNISHGIRPVKNFSPSAANEITDERCMDSFSYKLTDLMNTRGFNQETLAEYSGVSKGSINKYINKKSTPSITAFRKIAHALQCTLDELLD